MKNKIIIFFITSLSLIDRSLSSEFFLNDLKKNTSAESLDSIGDGGATCYSPAAKDLDEKILDIKNDLRHSNAFDKIYFSERLVDLLNEIQGE